jgi:hypothetical protein
MSSADTLYLVFGLSIAVCIMAVLREERGRNATLMVVVQFDLMAIPHGLALPWLTVGFQWEPRS